MGSKHEFMGISSKVQTPSNLDDFLSCEVCVHPQNPISYPVKYLFIPAIQYPEAKASAVAGITHRPMKMHALLQN